MKKAMFILLSAVLCFCLAGCKTIGMQQPVNSSVAIQALTQREDGSFSNGGIAISYPQFIGAETVNQRIADEVAAFAENISGGYYESAQAEVDYQLKTNSSTFISILFEGNARVGAGTEKPVLTSLNLNPQSGERVLLSELADIDDAFMQTLANHAEQTLDEQTALEFYQNLREIQQRLLLADTPQSSDFSYYSAGTLNLFLEDWEGNQIYLQEIPWDCWKLSAKQELVSEAPSVWSES